MRLVRTHKGHVARDYTPGTVFPNNPFKFKPGENILDIRKYCPDWEEIPFDGRDKELSTAIRSNSQVWSRTFQMQKLIQKPMLTLEDGIALLLPLDNELNCDYLTYRDELYQTIIGEIADEIFKQASSDGERDAALALLIDYSANNPFASVIRHDGRLTVSDKQWPGKFRDMYSRIISDVLKANFISAEGRVEEFSPSMNVTKSVGFNTRWPDGSAFDKKDFHFCPASFENDRPDNAWWRFDCGPFKLAWLESGLVNLKLQKTLDLARQGIFVDENSSALVAAFEDERLSVHGEAYRMNNPDTPILGNFQKPSDLIGKGHAKNRIGALEIKPFVFGSGTINDQYEQDLRRLNPGLRLIKNKKRPMFPAPNAVFSPPFIFLFRILSKPLEDGGIGFPSLAVASIKHRDEGFEFLGDTPRVIVTFDRKNSEQFITDNFANVLTLIPEWLRPIIRHVCTGVMPSLFGGRVSAGCLLSGTAPTTFLNMVVGAFECCMMIACIMCDSSEPTDAVLPVFEQVVLQLFKNGLVSYGDWRIVFQLGTDDQIFYVGNTRMSQDALKQHLEQLLPKYCEGRSLSCEVTLRATVFGLDWTTENASVAASLGLSKIFLMEKAKNGDQMAFKLHSRLQLLPQYAETIERVFRKYRCGTLGSYKKGSDNFIAGLIKTGYPVNELWNVHSSVDKLSMGITLSKLGIDPLTSVKRYPVEYLDPIYSTFKKFFNFHQ